MWIVDELKGHLALLNDFGVWCMRAVISSSRLTISTALLVCLLVLGSLPLLSSASPYHDIPSTSGLSLKGADVREQSKSIPNWHSVDRNWKNLSDSAGYVDVIISTGISDSTEKAHQKIARLLDSKFPASQAQDVRQSIDRGLKSEYSAPFSGISVHISVDILNLLLNVDSSIQAYPDLPVSAMLSESVYQVGADQVWNYLDPYGNTVRGNGVVVAVIDTGVDYNLPDLGSGFGSGHKVVGGYDFANMDADPMDDNGHGTHVAGIIAANGGMYGVAPEASILAYKVLGADGSAQMSTVISGIEAAMDPDSDGDTSDHADVISMSLGGLGEKDDPLCLAVGRAVELGIVVVVAAGNAGPTFGSVASPGLAPEAITVGAIDSKGDLATFSSRGTTPDLEIKPEISAPGVDIVSTVPYANARLSSPTGYMALSGTSMATPHVSGAAALLLQMHPDWTPLQVKSALVTGSSPMDESLWYAGAGGLWVPSAAQTSLFLSQPIVSYGLPSFTGKAVTLSNSGPGSTFVANAYDRNSLSYNGSMVTSVWTNLSSVSPVSLFCPSHGIAAISLTAPLPSSQFPEGYYEGAVLLSSGGRELRIPFGFAVLSSLSIHVIGPDGREVFDSGGYVCVYRVPKADIALGQWAMVKPTPPADFLLPAGNYSAHAAGHQVLYSYSGPYMLSGVVSLSRGEAVSLYLKMSEARKMTLDLRTEDGYPIYAKDFRLYCRYAGESVVSFHVHSFDLSIVGSDMFSLPSSRYVYVSNTSATVGISIAGYAYTPDMWDFINLNWNHWYEWANTLSTDFRIEATADLRYLLSWEFSGVNESTPLNLTVQRDKASVFETKYDIPGAIEDIWALGETHRAMGGESEFYVRRATGTSVNPIFSGMTRKVVVQGVFSEIYFPGSILEDFVERGYYSPDYEHMVAIDSIPGAYYADRNFLKSLSTTTTSERIGGGPFYPSLRTFNTDNSLGLLYPLLSDTGGARYIGAYTDGLVLRRDGVAIGQYPLDEMSVIPLSKRIMPLSSSGQYDASVNLELPTAVCSNVSISFGFKVPSADVNPPYFTGFEMPQRFVPGDSLDLAFTAVDDKSSVSVQVCSRATGASAWSDLAVRDLGSGRYSTIVPTSSGMFGIDLKVRISDLSGNYIEYIAEKASLRQVPVFFDILPNQTQLKYRSTSSIVTLTGYLRNQYGGPLDNVGGIPLEMIVDGRKVGMLLDEYMLSDSHTHDGNIRFDWTVNPTRLFSGPNETINVRIVFDLGVYEKVERSFQLHSVYDSVSPPSISTVPGNGSCISAGSAVTIAVVDDGQITASSYSIDGAQDWKPLLLTIIAPGSWAALVGTSGLSDGVHELRLSVTDDDQITVRKSVIFEVDATAPRIEFDGLTNGSQIPINWRIKVNASDTHLLGMNYSLDNVESSFISSASEAMIYFVETQGLDQGTHTLTVSAKDAVGHVSYNTLHFEIVNSSVTAVLVSPRQDLSGETVIRSGTPIVLSVFGFGDIKCVWTEAQVTHTVSAPYEISTTGWIEGQHDIMINVSNNIGGVFGLEVILSIDDTPPGIVVAPLNATFVGPKDQIVIDVTESHLATVIWRILDSQYQVTGSHVVIPLDDLSINGLFSVEIVANDKAGNCRAVVVAYTMDITPPFLGMEGVASGEAIPAGRELNLSVQDMSLSSVRWSMDVGDLTSITAPYSIDTRLFTAGYHVLMFTAEDSVGLSSWFNISIYVDRAPPVIVQGWNGYYEIGSALEILANVTDDFLVERVFLLYELRNGSFERMSMDKSGSIFSTNLSNDKLWDGMTMFIQATDSVGNFAEGNHVKLQVRSGAHDPASGLLRGFPLENIGFICMIVVGLIVSIAFIVQQNYSARDAGRLSGGRGRRFNASLVRTRNEVIIESPMAASHSSCDQATPQPTHVTRTIAATAVSRSFEPVSSVMKETTPLLDAIPAILSIPKHDLVGTSDEDVDYGALIERELIIPSIKNSVFGDLVKDARNIPLVKAVNDTRILPQIQKNRITSASDTVS